MDMSNFYRTNIICDDYVDIGGTVLIKVSVKDFTDNYVFDEPIKLMVVDVNGSKSTLYDGRTKLSYLAINYTPSMQGLYTLECNGVKKQFYVGGWASYNLSSACTLYYNETEVIMIVSGTVTHKNGAYITNWTIPSDYSFLRPFQKVVVSGHPTGTWQVNAQGEIKFMILTGSTTANATSAQYVEAYWCRGDMS